MSAEHDHVIGSDIPIQPAEQVVDVATELIGGLMRRNTPGLENIDLKKAVTDVLRLVAEGHAAISGNVFDPFDPQIIHHAHNLLFTDPPAIAPDMDTRELRDDVLKNHIAQLLTGSPDGSFRNNPVALHHARRFRDRFVQWHTALVEEAQATADTHHESQLLIAVLHNPEPPQPALVASVSDEIPGDPSSWKVTAKGDSIADLPRATDPTQVSQAVEPVDKDSVPDESLASDLVSDAQTTERKLQTTQLALTTPSGSVHVIDGDVRDVVLRFTDAFRRKIADGYLPIASAAHAFFPDTENLTQSERQRVATLSNKFRKQLLSIYRIFDSKRGLGYTLNVPFEVLDALATTTESSLELPIPFASRKELLAYLGPESNRLIIPDSPNMISGNSKPAGNSDSPPPTPPTPPSHEDAEGQITVDILDRDAIITVLTDMLEKPATIQDMDGTQAFFPQCDIALSDKSAVILSVLEKIGITHQEYTMIVATQPLSFEGGTRRSRETLGQVLLNFEQNATDNAKKAIVLRLKKGLLSLIDPSKEAAIGDIVTSTIPGLLARLTNQTDVKKK